MFALPDSEKVSSVCFSFRYNTRTLQTDGQTDTARRHKPRCAVPLCAQRRVTKKLSTIKTASTSSPLSILHVISINLRILSFVVLRIVVRTGIYGVYTNLLQDYADVCNMLQRNALHCPRTTTRAV